jgi:hypothetical protein
VTSCSVCITIADSELSLIEIRRSIPPHLLKVCSAHKDKAEIKCMDSVGGKTPHNQNFIHTSLALGILNMIRLIFCTLFILITWVTRSEG